MKKYQEEKKDRDRGKNQLDKEDKFENKKVILYNK